MSIPILFLHGWAMDGAIFQNLATCLGPDFDCHAPDLPGHGVNPTDAPNLDSCVELTRWGIAELDRPIVVGWSMGAAVAWRYISRYGTSGVRGLVTIDMSPRMLPDTDWDLGLLGQSAEDILATSSKIEPNWHRMVNSIIRNMYATDAEDAHQNTAMRAFLRAQDPERLRPLWDDLTALDERKTIAKIDIPYLVCTGMQSRLYSADVGRWIAQTAQQARVESFRNSGHSPHIEEPETFCEALRRFAVIECAPR
ncbi:AB hydrolase superfamily protein YdjP [Tritonibacter multivorans]|uniref:AB hydrolase superfamily protein YdjP n=1 Tax=Tritonibacter multivorans TaxID=928856 RepID=A0A0P1GKP3_9RHOB|nr:alpha/beta hydrolase [Tritonibacter multivorans]MDA7422184.1 alpha/beta hydrolase [Tritonibacter multivorans]CUH74762.1 AB hydrolase superfamily protein YdjP [Tritonibacter multivorans]SFD69439.1 Pimeloyl-ACP methyl ester carboxylesterase [Tritonibacter multivorans]